MVFWIARRRRRKFLRYFPPISRTPGGGNFHLPPIFRDPGGEVDFPLPPHMVEKKHPPEIWGKLDGGGSPGQNYLFFLKQNLIFFQIDVSLWRQNTKTMFLWQTDFIQFLTRGPPPWTWAKRFSLIPKKMKKTDNLQKFAIFFKLFSSWFHFLFFWNQSFLARVTGNYHFLKR